MIVEHSLHFEKIVHCSATFFFYKKKMKKQVRKFLPIEEKLTIHKTSFEKQSDYE